MTHRLTGFVLVSLLTLGLQLGCHRDRKEAIARSPEASDSLPIAPLSNDAAISEDPVERARVVVAAMKRKDLKSLAAMIHPKKGVRFSPYAYVDPTSDVTLQAAQVEDGISDGTERVWGSADGSGDPIRLTFAKYFDRFVYDADFASVSEPALDSVVASGNTINNAKKIYAGATMVELYVPGTTKYEGMDWKSLRLVFERDGEHLWLVGVIHDEWTI